jgi:four helix bundle protein
MKTAFERLEVYQLSERLGDAVWDMALGWDSFAKDTLGKQLVRAADSVGANIAEGYGRGTGADNRRFVRTARGSLNETQHWLRRAYRRKLMTKAQVNLLKPLVEELGPRLNAYLKSIRVRGDDNQCR